MKKVQGISILCIALILLLVPIVTSWASGAKEAAKPGPTTVTFRLNWKTTGPHVAYYLGKSLGYYQEENIDLQILEGTGSVTVAQLIANKSDMIGLADATALMPSLAKGMPIKAIGMVSPKSSLAVVARKDRNINTLKDLEGKRLALTAGDSLTQIWPAVVAANNLNAGKIELVYVDAAAKVPVVLEGKADALLGSSADQNFILEERGVPVVCLNFADYGVNVLNLALWAHVDTIKQNPDLLRRFLRATKKSLEAWATNKEKAVQVTAATRSDLDPKVIAKQADAYFPLLKSPNQPSAPLLTNVAADWEQTFKLMKQYRGLETTMKVTDFYTNELLP